MSACNTWSHGGNRLENRKEGVVREGGEDGVGPAAGMGKTDAIWNGGCSMKGVGAAGRRGLGGGEGNRANERASVRSVRLVSGLRVLVVTDTG